jgi:hypothetical protein
MTWKFDYLTGDIVFKTSNTIQIFDALINFGSVNDGDLQVDCGDRGIEGSVVDQGLRLIETGE